MCSNCKDVAKLCRPKLHEEKFCPLLRAGYCSICCSKGHFTSDCPNSTAMEYRKPQFMEQLIPFSKLQEYRITTRTPLPSFQEPPEDYFCPISKEIMVDPVIACKGGHVFEKTVIEQWLKTHKTCPTCRCSVDAKEIRLNRYMKGEIQRWRQVSEADKQQLRHEAVLEVEESNPAMRNILMNHGKPLSVGLADNRRRLQNLADELKLKLVFIPIKKNDSKSKNKKGTAKTSQTAQTAH